MTGSSNADQGAARGPRRVRWALVALLVLVAVNAVYGGIGLMVDGIGMPSDWLTGTPFDSWLLPGLALLATVAVPQAVVAGMVIAGHRRAALAAVLAGAGLVAWIVVQVLVLRRHFFLQPVIAALGAVQWALAWWWLTRWRRDGTTPGR